MRSLTLKAILASAFITLALVIGIQLYLLVCVQQGNDQLGENVVKSIHTWLTWSLVLILILAILGIILFRFYKRRSWNRRQKDFINNFMHEFRTPVSVISIASKVLQTEGIESQTARLKRYAGIIKAQTDQLNQKVSLLMELALSDGKEPILEKEVVNINSLVTSAISFVQPMVEEKKASIEFINSKQPIEVNGDSIHLIQVIVNLLDNSLKYANQPRIRLETVQADKVCFISVKDNGIGMESKYLKHIFRKYYRIPTGNIHNVKGFGIGLNFVKKVIDAHNGRIEVSSVTGLGTEFRIQLPLT